MQAWLYPGKQIKYQVTYSQRERKAVVPFQQAYRFSNVHKKYTGRYLILTENEIPGRQKVVRWSKVPVLTSHAGLNPRSKLGNESGFAGELSKKICLDHQQRDNSKPSLITMIAYNTIFFGNPITLPEEHRSSLPSYGAYLQT